MIDVIRFIAQLESVHNEFVSSFLELQTAFLEMLKSGEEPDGMKMLMQSVREIISYLSAVLLHCTTGFWFC